MICLQDSLNLHFLFTSIYCILLLDKPWLCCITLLQSKVSMGYYIRLIAVFVSGWFAVSMSLVIHSFRILPLQVFQHLSIYQLFYVMFFSSTYQVITLKFSCLDQVSQIRTKKGMTKIFYNVEP